MEMPKIIEWFKSNKLHTNVYKTVAMLFHTRQRRVNIDENLIVIDGNIIPFTTSTKFLGINIDNNLTWKAHINYITSKISFSISLSFIPLLKKINNLNFFQLIEYYASIFMFRN